MENKDKLNSERSKERDIEKKWLLSYCKQTMDIAIRGKNCKSNNVSKTCSNILDELRGRMVYIIRTDTWKYSFIETAVLFKVKHYSHLLLFHVFVLLNKGEKIVVKPLALKIVSGRCFFQLYRFFKPFFQVSLFMSIVLVWEDLRNYILF